jgi:hypothetical protein
MLLIAPLQADRTGSWTIVVKDTSICIVDDTGRIAREVKVASEPDALLAVLLNASREISSPEK